MAPPRTSLLTQHPMMLTLKPPGMKMWMGRELAVVGMTQAAMAPGLRKPPRAADIDPQCLHPLPRSPSSPQVLVPLPLWPSSFCTLPSLLACSTARINNFRTHRWTLLQGTLMLPFMLIYNVIVTLATFLVNAPFYLDHGFAFIRL